MTNKLRHRLRPCYLFLAVTCAAWSGGCLGTPPPSDVDRVNNEIPFRTAWERALGHLRYDEVVQAWGAPTSLRQTDASLVAEWRWDHPLPFHVEPRSAAVFDTPVGSFGEGLELTFHPKTKVLRDWKYSRWGPRPAQDQHGDAVPAGLSPPGDTRPP